ncbi:MAG: aldehyde dehydrogenase family protein, partial [Pseudomonadota bacterium]
MQTLPLIQHLIDGELVAGGSRTQNVFNPATGQAEKRLLLADKVTVEQAIASAHAAYPAWRATPPLKRARVMSKLKVLLEENADQICALVTAEHGKVLSDAMVYQYLLNLPVTKKFSKYQP